MLAMRDLEKLGIAGLHQWIDDAQLTLGQLNSLVEATWFRPSTSAIAPSAAAPAAAQS
jgi:hypothetical protein